MHGIIRSVRRFVLESLIDGDSNDGNNASTIFSQLKSSSCLSFDCAVYLFLYWKVLFIMKFYEKFFFTSVRLLRLFGIHYKHFSDFFRTLLLSF
jgi:hypothetical protein